MSVRVIFRAEAEAIFAEYQVLKSLPKVARVFGRSVSAAHTAMKHYGLIVPKPTPRLDEDFVRKMHADYEGGLTLSALARKWGRSRRNLAEIFKRRGLPLRPCEIAMNLCPATGQMLAKPRKTAAEIDAALAGMTKMEVPRALWLEWRKWTLAERGAFIARARARLRLENERPEGPFSANVVPFSYATPAAQKISAALNKGCSSRNKRVQLRFGSQGVIYQGKLWFWTTKTGYLHGRWTAAAPRKELHHAIWEETHGRAVPPSHVVRFADGNANNFDPANLRLATRNDLARENQAGALIRKARTVTALLLSQTQKTNPKTHENRSSIESIVTRRQARKT